MLTGIILVWISFIGGIQEGVLGFQPFHYVPKTTIKEAFIEYKRLVYLFSKFVKFSYCKYCNFNEPWIMNVAT